MSKSISIRRGIMIASNTIKESGERVCTDRLARHIAGILIPANPAGFTFDPLTFQLLPDFDYRIWPGIYPASVDGNERVFSTIPSIAEIHSWISDTFERLCIYGNFIGFWEHNKDFYLDITNAVYGHNRAIAFGSSNGQQAIFHPFTNEEVPIGYHNDAEVTNSSEVCHMAAGKN